MLWQEEEEECSRQENTLSYHGDEAGLWRSPEGLASQDTLSLVLPSSLRKPPGLHSSKLQSEPCTAAFLLPPSQPWDLLL